MRTLFLFGVLLVSGWSHSLAAQQSLIHTTFIVATPLDQAVQLHWSVAKSGVVNFVVEKSRNGAQYDSVSWGNCSNVLSDYMETDFSPYEGTSWYRLRMTDEAGNITFSNVVPVRYLQGNPIPLLTPQGFTSKEANILLVVLADGAGQEHYSKVVIDIDGNPVLATDLENRLHSGCYQIVACSDQNYYSRSLTVR